MHTTWPIRVLCQSHKNGSRKLTPKMLIGVDKMDAAVDLKKAQLSGIFMSLRQDCFYHLLLYVRTEHQHVSWLWKKSPSNLYQKSCSKFIWLKWYSFLTWNASAVNAAAFCVYCPRSLFWIAPSPIWSFSIMGSLPLTLSSCSQAFTWDNNVGRIS